MRMDTADTLALWHRMEKPQTVLRALRHSDGRIESDAEHMWRLAVMAMAVAPRLARPVGLDRLIKLALAHDVCEMDIGDTPAFDSAVDAGLKARKEAGERATMEHLAVAHPQLGTDLLALWEEYERQETFEAQVLKALDKIDARVTTADDASAASWPAARRETITTILTERGRACCAIDPFLADLYERCSEERHARHGW